MSKNLKKEIVSPEHFGKIDFIGKIGLFGSISAIMVVISLLYLGIKGLPYGIDFVGGSEIQVQFESPVQIEDFRSLAKKVDLPNYSVQSYGGDKDYLVRFQVSNQGSDDKTNQVQNSLVTDFKNQLQDQFAGQKPQIVRVDSVGPQVGSELKRSGFLSVFYSLLIILVYVGLRFDYKYAPGAVLCLFHDAVISLAIFAFMGREVNVPVVAAVLTLIGFSLNDTIVVFDRIRETEHVQKKIGFGNVINKAINEMLYRTIITSGTTFVMSLALLIFSGGSIGDIALIMTMGILIGTYSSIYVAAPIALWFDKMFGGKVGSILPKPKFSDSSVK